MRPIAEIMFIDFAGVCLDQIFNHIAKNTYMSGGSVKMPLVLMAGAGGGYCDAAQHSQCLWGMFAHLPDLKVVVPSTPYDAKGLMISAFRDDSPVTLHLPQGAHGPGLDDPGEGRHRSRAGGALHGSHRQGRHQAGGDRRHHRIRLHGRLQSPPAAEELAKEGISAEVLDLRSLVPLDRDAIVESVKKTHRLLVVDEDYLSYGMTGEVAATVAERALEYLDAPVKRLAVPDVPIPFSRPLEQAVLPDAPKIVAAVRELMAS